MKTFPLKTVWFKTVQGTELERYNWDEITQVLVEQGMITLIAPPGADTFTRYKLNHEKFIGSKDQMQCDILKALAKHLPLKYGERK